MSLLKVRAPLAMRIAQIDRDRFNEAVARGDYPCAPRVVAGATRIFALDDLVVLCIYGHLVNTGEAPRKAGLLADAVHAAMHRLADIIDDLRKDLDSLTLCAVFAAGDWHGFLSGSINPARLKQIGARIKIPTISPIASSLTIGDIVEMRHWPLGFFVRRIEREIENYRTTLGEEEAIG